MRSRQKVGAECCDPWAGGRQPLRTGPDFRLSILVQAGGDAGGAQGGDIHALETHFIRELLRPNGFDALFVSVAGIDADTFAEEPDHDLCGLHWVMRPADAR